MRDYIIVVNQVLSEMSLEPTDSQIGRT